MLFYKNTCLLLLLAAMACGPYVVRAQPANDPLKDSLLHELSIVKEDTNRIKIMYRLSRNAGSNDAVKAQMYADSCMSLSKQKNWHKGVGLAYVAMGTIQYGLSHYDTSIQYDLKAYAIFKEILDKDKMGIALVGIANDYIGSGLYAKSVENNLAALKLFEETRNDAGLSAALNNIGIAYYNLLEYDKAIEYYKKGLLTNTTADKFEIASGLDNIAMVYLDENKYDSADVYDLKAVKLFEDINDLAALGRIYLNRGNILMHLHNAAGAYEFYNRSMNLNTKLGITVEIAADNRSFGNLYLELAKDSFAKYTIAPFMNLDKTAQLMKARDYFLKGLTLGKKSGDLSRLMDYNSLLSETEERLGHYQPALAFQKASAMYKDSIFNDDNRKKVEAMETERLTEVKDQQIQLISQQKALAASEYRHNALVKDIILAAVIVTAALVFVFIFLYNRRRKAMFEKKVMDVETKALRAQMNPHFIFNSLHSINTYVRENDKENASSYLLKFAGLMRFILENSRSQEVTLEKDLQALEVYMQLESLRARHAFKYSIETDPQIDAENTLVPPMLLQPFVENAILHGVQHKTDGFIKIKVRKENDMVCCLIEDNGKGMERVAANSADAAKGKSHTSLGKKIVNERLAIINQLKKVKASVNIFDIKNADNKSAGVQVKLLLPFTLAF